MGGNTMNRLTAAASVVGLAVLAGSTALGDNTAYTWQMLKDNPRFYWSFNETGSTDNAVDLVRGQTNDELIAQGDAQRGSSAGLNLATAATLDGAGDFFLANALNDHAMPGTWAIETWVKADGSLSGSRGDYLTNAPTNNPGFIYDFGVGGDNKIELFSAAGRTAGGGPTINDNTQWHHLVATFYGNGAGFGVADRVDMAIDGAVSTVPRGGFSAGFALGGQFFVGAATSGGANAFEGLMDEVALYDLSGLTEAQVATRTAQIAGHYNLASQPAATNLAYVPGTTYDIDAGTPPGAGVYDDPSETKLTDAVIGSTGASPWGSDEWVGWQTVDPIVTFDLNETQRLDTLLVDYLVSQRVGIRAPDSVTVEFSQDGVDFTSIASIVSTAFNDFDPTPADFTGWNRRIVVDLDDTQAQYVRLTFANDETWTFLGEVQFIEQIPEPSSFLLAALGLVGLAFFARRRR